MDMEEHINEVIRISREAQGEEEGATVIRWAVVAEVMSPTEEHPDVVTTYGLNMTPWALKGMAWLLDKDAEDMHDWN